MSARESPSSTLANDSQILTLNISSILRYNWEVSVKIARNFAEITGSQWRASKIKLRWMPFINIKI